MNVHLFNAFKFFSSVVVFFISRIFFFFRSRLEDFYPRRSIFLLMFSVSLLKSSFCSYVVFLISFSCHCCALLYFIEFKMTILNYLSGKLLIFISLGLVTGALVVFFGGVLFA